MVRFLLFKLALLLCFSELLAQPVFTIQNKKDACDGLNNGSFEILVSSAAPPPLRAFIFGPPDDGPFNLTVGTPFLVSGLQGAPGGKTYLVVVQDSNGSSIQFVTIFSISPDLSASVASATNNTNCAAPNGAIDINVSGGTGSYSYQWTGPSGFVDPGTQDLTGLAGGNYSVLIRDNGTNCTRTLGPITITDPSPAIQNVTTPSPQYVCAGNDATITLAATQPSPVTYQVLINGNPFGTPQTNPAAPGPFTLTVPSGSFASGDVLTVRAVDGLCTPVLMNGSVTIIIQNLTISSSVTPNTRCTAPFNGAVNITVSGAIGSLSYNWSGPGGPYSTEDLSNVQHGSYTVVVTDNTTGCQATATINVPDGRPTLTLTNTVTPNSRCVAPFNGAINLTVSGSTGPFTYAWTGPGGPYSTEDLSNIQDGSYTVVVTDVPSGCTATANITVNNTAPTLALTSTVTPNSRCVAPFNGGIDLTVSGSTGPFTYAWTGPGGPYSTEDLSNIQDGSYTVVVTDVPSGCTATANITVNNTAPTLTLTSTVTPNSRCVAPFNGAINLTVSGSTGPFTYAWTGPGGPYSTEDLSNIQDGSYTVVVTDVPSGCTATANITVNNTAPTLTLTSTVTPNSRCVAPFNGAINLTVSGSTGPFTYAWTGPGGPYSTEDLSNIQDGSYTVVVTDVPSGCTATANITVNNTAPTLTLTSTVTPNSRCVAPFNGAINLTVSGSTGPFTYAWTGPGGPYSTEDLSNIQDGSYTVVVTDVPSGCTATANITVNSTAPTLTLTSTVTPNSRCVAPFNGAIDLTVSGSTGPFTYAWTGPGGPYSTEDLSNIQDGSYTVVVTDVPSGCTATANITVNNTAPTLTLTNTVTPNSRCVAPFNGAINLTVSGSTGPFTYAWTGPGGFTSASEDISNLQPGVYDVTVTDNPSSCVVTASYTVNDISVVPTLTSTVVDNDRCNAPFNGAILLTVSPPAFYTFSWTGPGGYTSSLEDITALAPGLYTVTVTNPTTGCSTNQSFTVNNIAPTVSITPDAIGPNSSCLAPFNGFILVTVSPAGSYTYSWTGPGGYTSSSEDISGLREGDYTLTATNTSLGCSATSTFTVGDLTPTISITSQTIIDNSNCVAPFNGSITVTAGGTPGPYTFSWSGPGGYNGTGSSISGLQSGNYTVTITDLTIGCQDVYTLTVGDAAPPITVTLDAMSPNTNCLAPFTGALSITVSGTPGPFSFSWSGPGGYTSTNEDISGLEQGDYQVTVQDTGLGCQATVTFTVGDGRPVVGITGLSVNPNSSCVAPFTGSISLSGSGTPGPFTYSWTGPGGYSSSSQNISGLNSGDYTVTVRDQILGCEGVFTINVPSTAPTITLTSSVSGNTTCIPPFNGSINITAGGTPGPYSYSWTGPGGYTSSNEDISNLQAGDYTVIVQDTGLGCQGTFTITVPENAPVLNITLVSNTPNSNCLAPFNGALDITISGTPGPYNISWSGPGGFSAASEDISGLRPGVYNLSVQDVLLGCAATASFTVNNIASGCGGLGCLAFTVTTTEVRPSCAVQDDGSITFTISGGTPNYIVTLTDSAGFTVSKPGAGPVFSFTNLSPANYYYIIQDASFPSPNVCALPYSLPVQTNVQATASGFVDATCFGQPTGQATLTVISGGASPYEYSIDAGASWISFTSPHTITNLPPNGTYSILVRDDASDLCPAQVPVTINNLNPQIQQPFAVQQATCSNNDGKIILTGPPSGGTGAPYSYLLNGVPSVPTGGEFANLSAGTYVLTVQDNSGCQRNFNVTITFPGFVNTSPVTVSPPDCTSGGTNGSISFNILDIGTFSFFVTTNPLYVPVASDYIALGGTFVLIPNLVNGTYYVWLKSAGAQCATRLGPVNVTGVYALSYSFTPSDEICFGDGGSVTLTNITGAPDLNYQYELVLGGVPTTGTITFLESLGPYTISGLAPGNYQIRLTQDQTSLNGCVAVTPYQSFTITGPASALGFTGVENISESYPDQPTGSMIVVIAESGEEPYELRVELTEPVLGGQAYLRDFQVVNRNAATLRIQEQFINLYAGVYTLTVRDALGCVRTTEVEVPVDTDIFIPNMFTPNGDGVNDVFFIRNLPEGSRLIITNRWGNQVFQSANYPVNANDTGLWDGGNESDGVYYYRLQAAGQVYTGWVEIVRGRKP